MERYCLSCMNKLDSGNVCRKCGYTFNENDIDKLAIKSGYVLDDRYYVGLPTHKNGEGITYLAFDSVSETPVSIKELFPDTICIRNENGVDVMVKRGCEVQFKALTDDFVELSQKLMEINCDELERVQKILELNGTVYTVYEQISGDTLTKYLIDNAGELTYAQAKQIFIPLLKAIRSLNNAGIIHRGISPETIMISNGKAKLCGICISSARAINSEISCELYDGYAAPEQYQACVTHGEWTDIYAISAVLYKSFTGTMLTSADFRDPYTELTPPNQLNISIPKRISDGIMSGLNYNRLERIMTVDDFIEDFSDNQRTKTMVISESVPIIKENSQKLEKERKFKIPIWLIVLLITLPLMMGVFFTIYYTVLVKDNTPKDYTSSTASETSNASSKDNSNIVSSVKPSSSVASNDEPSLSLDNFVGKMYEDIVSSLTYKDKLKFKKIEEFNENIQIGEIIHQNKKPNEIVKQDTEIELTVSKGTRYITLPPIIDENGMTIKVADYSKALKYLGIDSEIQKLSQSEFPSGTLVALSQEAGSILDRETSNKVILFIAP